MILTILILIGFILLLLLWSRKYKSVAAPKPKIFWGKVETMFVENAGDGLWSANRVAYVFTMILSNLVLWGGVLYLVIHSSAFPDIPQNIIILYGIANGVASIAKVWQKREEGLTAEIESKVQQNKDVLNSSDTQNQAKLNSSDTQNQAKLNSSDTQNKN